MTEPCARCDKQGPVAWWADRGAWYCQSCRDVLIDAMFRTPLAAP